MQAVADAVAKKRGTKRKFVKTSKKVLTNSVRSAILTKLSDERLHGRTTAT